jgi:phosphatidylglycerophosphatase A
MSALNFFTLLITTFFYIGFTPLIPGTFGSIAGLSLFYLVRHSGILYALVTLIVIFLGFLFSTRAEGILNKKDPAAVVIDEVAGMLLTLMFIPYDTKLIIIGFFLFRLLDTLKPYPADKLQKLKGSLGIMGDDIIAGLYANIVLQLVARIVLLRGS